MPATLFVLFALFVPVTSEVEFVTTDLPWAIADKGYAPLPLEVRVSGTCPLGGVGFAVASGSLPPGIQLSRLGYFSGVPLRTGEYTFVVRAADGCGSVDKQFTLIVSGAPILKAEPARIEFECKAGENPTEKQVQVSATWPKLPYQVSAGNAAWLKAEPESGFTPRQTSAMGADVVHLTVDTTGLKPGRYRTSLIVSSWQAVEAPRVEVELTVK